MSTEDGHQAHINGREIPAAAKRGEFHELRDHAVRCPCRGSTLARFYVGRDEATGEPAGWVWTPARVTAGGVKVPPAAATIAHEAGQVAWTQIAQCSRCRGTWIVFPGGVGIDLAEDARRFVFRDGPAEAKPWQAGDEYVTGVLSDDQINGAGPCVLVRLESPTWGTVQN